ncbi:uroporphyrinogen-III synthase [Dyella sp. M7H15-1]|nr:uroporphyrinogen-III synthase [Dyella sp. M7H15-1]
MLPYATLAGCTMVITRPAGTGSALARQVRRLGGTPLLLPGLSLHAVPVSEALRAAWRAAQHDEFMIFTSPAAVRYAMALGPCDAHGVVIAVGQGTAGALRRHGMDAQMPAERQASEGVLQLPVMEHLQGRHVALVTAPGGRGLLQEQIAARGASLREVYVYRRGAPRLHRRHIDAVLHLPSSACVLLSSGEAMQHLMERLPDVAWQRLCHLTTIVSSERLAEQARAAGFKQVQMAASAGPADMLATAMKVCSHTRYEADRAGC